MILDLQTAPTVEPVTVAEVKSWSRISVSDDDALIAGKLIPMARRATENYLQRALITQTWDLWMGCFMDIEVPMAPLQSVSSITYTDSTGSSQTLSTSIYDVFTYAEHPGYVRLAYGQSWPTTRIVNDAVKIRFVAGYGESGTSVPQDILAGLMATFQDYYENRESIVIGSAVNTIPGYAEKLLWPHRLTGF